MPDLLRRQIAPISEEAWEEIEEVAKKTIKSQLSGRAVVDVDGPYGWKHAAVNTGRLDIAANQPIPGVHWGTRLVLPLMEVRVPFHLNQMELDSITRGVKDPDFNDLEKAARQTALFEEQAIFNGIPDTPIKGIIPSCSHEPIRLQGGLESLPHAVASGLKLLQEAGIGGPFHLVLGDAAFFTLMQAIDEGYPIYKVVENLVEGRIHRSPALRGGVLLSGRGGDFELTIGQDISIGYAAHDKDQVELYFTESFTFRVLEAAACVPIELQQEPQI
ncbi:MAG: bacteriocin family protein [Bryobacterales bacterium]|nr:bacteriocin family protein [Bryobacterales bacterium]